MSDAKGAIVQYREDIKGIMKDPEVFRSLLENTFKGLEKENVPKALLEGMLRGFTIKDFMTKNVYAVPFKNYRDNKQDYSIVTAISHVRKIAMRSGQTGKSAPIYTEIVDVMRDEKDEVVGHKKSIETCSVTVWRKDGDDRGYTATVFFNEYEKPAFRNAIGKEVPGMWQQKPRTMIAKVAEMHALRMAFPEELGEMYVEEEFDKPRVIDVTFSKVDETEREGVLDVMSKKEKVEDLVEFFKGLSPELRKDDAVVDAYTKCKDELSKPKPEKKDV